MASCNTCLIDRHSEKSIIYTRYSQLLKTSLDSNSYLAETSLGEAVATKKNIRAESKMGHTHIEKVIKNMDPSTGNTIFSIFFSGKPFHVIVPYSLRNSRSPLINLWEA